jgi:hypothetical protein
MKPKLLITLGCSHTEGWGNWDINTFPKALRDKVSTLKRGEHLFQGHMDFDKKDYQNIIETLHIKNYDNFHNNGWPMNLAKLLKVDKLVNLGRGGSGNSGQIKTLFEKNIHNNPYEEYEVLVIWQMTEPHRLSYYFNNEINDVMTDDYESYKGYIKDMTVRETDSKMWSGHNLPLSDATLESVFYYKILEFVCEQNNWKLLTFAPELIHSDIWQGQAFEHFLKSDNYHRYSVFGRSYNYCDESKPYLLSALCGHHNEEGYKVIAKKIFDFIETKPRYRDIKGNNEGEVSMEWLGAIQRIPRKSYKL